MLCLQGCWVPHTFKQLCIGSLSHRSCQQPWAGISRGPAVTAGRADSRTQDFWFIGQSMFITSHSLVVGQQGGSRTEMPGWVSSCMSPTRTRTSSHFGRQRGCHCRVSCWKHLPLWVLHRYLDSTNSVLSLQGSTDIALTTTHSALIGL